jgi:hypothetical protein
VLNSALAAHVEYYLSTSHIATERHRMKLDKLPIGITDWSLVTPSVQQGGLGTATKRIRQFGDMKIRLIEFSANFVSDQWCDKGHIVFVAAGGVTIVHKNGDTYPLSQSGTYHVSDDVASPHRLESRNGATIFVVD